MPEDKKDDAVHSFDKEPSTGSPHSHDTTEHADIDHRIEAETTPDAPVDPAKQTPSAASTASTPAVAPVASQPDIAPVAAQPTSHVADDSLPKAGPGLMVLQWLTYAFWGWTVLSLSGLVLLVVNQMISNDDGSFFGGGIAYLLAAVIVLFIISLVSDVFYAGAEKKHTRSSGTNVIMIIHAVLFALFGIGALITSVFGVVSLMIGESGGSEGAISSVITGAIVAVIYGFTLLRTLRPKWIKGVVPMYWGFMTLVVVAAVGLGVVGPVAYERLRNADAVIENELPALATAINEQTEETGELPKSLSDVKSYDLIEDQAQRDKFLATMVTYTPGQRLTSSTPAIVTPSESEMLRLGQQTDPPVYHYELCVEYKTKSGSGRDDFSREKYGDEQRYPTDIYTYNHEVGKQCYDVQTDYLY